MGGFLLGSWGGQLFYRAVTYFLWSTVIYYIFLYCGAGRILGVILVLCNFIIFLTALLKSFMKLNNKIVVGPILSIVGTRSLARVSFFSSYTIFTVSVASAAHRVVGGAPVGPSVILLITLNSINNNLLKGCLFGCTLDISSAPGAMENVRSTVLTILLIYIVVFISNGFGAFGIGGPVTVLLSKLLLNATTTFLNVNNKPVGITFLALVFSFAVESTTICSITIVFFSRYTGVVSACVGAKFSKFSVGMLLIVVPITIVKKFVNSVLGEGYGRGTVGIAFAVTMSSITTLSLCGTMVSFVWCGKKAW